MRFHLKKDPAYQFGDNGQKADKTNLIFKTGS